MTMGLLTLIQCPCGLSETGFDCLTPLDDEYSDSVPLEEQLKCASCGRIFIAPGFKHQGKIVSYGRTYDEERSQGITRNP